jgi:hypothetical protein
MDDLVQFLRARLDEDERRARRAIDGPRNQFVSADEDIDPLLFDEDGTFALPARVLAEVDTKRQMIDEYARNAEAAEAEQCPNEWNGGIDKLGHFVLPLLALPYAGHPDYRDEWRP